MRTGKRQEAKGGINNQSLITGFSITLIFVIEIAVTTSPPSLETKNILPDHP
ncbi:hypothetical protein [Microcystis aeruginosa]|uniref:hypothetical protein n=1 Tax=Microcystis aeruginosa TaxID=1126 RepID=UPI001254C358|nr:hypothetical protein [Microcystis aeruginosa]GCA90344.1 hypothetical protein MiTa_03703 [Microcystis aeruginosa NIES-4264]